MTGGVDLERGNRIGASLNARVLGSYRLMRPIGRGRTAEVYLAEHVASKTQVAVKLLLLHLTGDEQRAFLHDMQIIAALNHPHLVRIIDYGVAGDVPYIAMAYAPHGTLSRILPTGQPLRRKRFCPTLSRLPMPCNAPTISN